MGEFTAAMQSLTEQSHDAEEKLQVQLDLVEILVKRLKYMNEKAPRWVELDASYTTLDRAFWKVIAGRNANDDLIEAEFEVMSDALDKAHGNLSTWVEELEKGNQVPKLPPVHQRAWTWLKVRKRQVTA